MNKKIHIKKGDMVQVIAGDDKSTPERVTQGRVLEIINDKKTGRVRAIVEGVNMVTKSTKPNAKNTNGGFVRKEAPIDISNLSHIDPKTKKATRIGRRMENGKMVRYAKKSGEVIK